jgi:TetR/AcrR family transcriptional repressor of bet genes
LGVLGTFASSEWGGSNSWGPGIAARKIVLAPSSIFYIIMVMPKRVDPEAQRRLISQAAITVIHELGLEGARLRDVARAAHITTGAVMHYFDGRDAVLEAAMEEVVRGTLERLETQRTEKLRGDPEALLVRLGRYLPLDASRLRDWRVWLAFWGRAMTEPRLREIHRRYYQALLGGLRPSLEALRRRSGPPSPEQLAMTADALLAAVDGVGCRATLEPEDWPAGRQLNTFGTLARPILRDFMENRSLADRSGASGAPEPEPGLEPPVDPG